MKKQSKDLEWLKNDLIAHRGLHDIDNNIPENSKLSFIKAMEKNYSIEFDINVLKDGTVIVFHDGDFNRACGINKKCNELTYDEIKDFRLFNTDEKIMTLKEALDLVNGKVNLLIELKVDSIRLLFDSFIKDIKDYKGNYAVFSFHPKIVHYFKKEAPHIIRGQISGFLPTDPMPKIQKWALNKMILNLITKPDFVSYNIKLMPNKVLDRIQRKGIVVIGFVAKSLDEYLFAKKHYSNMVFEGY